VGGFFGGDADETYAKKEKLVENSAKKVDMIAKGLAFSEVSTNLLTPSITLY